MSSAVVGDDRLPCQEVSGGGRTMSGTFPSGCTGWGDGPDRHLGYGAERGERGPGPVGQRRGVDLTGVGELLSDSALVAVLGTGSLRPDAGLAHRPRRRRVVAGDLPNVGAFGVLGSDALPYPPPRGRGKAES